MVKLADMVAHLAAPVALAGWFLAVPVLPAGAAEPFSTEIAAFGQRGDLHLLGLEAGRVEAVISRVKRDLAELERLLDPKGDEEGGFGRLNAAAGGAPVTVREPAFTLLARSAAFCRWTDGITSLLGGRLYTLWGLSQPVAALPSSLALDEARESATCDRLVVNAERGSASLAAGSLIEPWGFALGAAVDVVVAALEAEGVTNAFVSLGLVARGIGPGPQGKGWGVTPPAYPGLTEPLAEIWLKDRALAAASPEDGRLGAAGEWFPPYLDLRRGRPAEGIVAVLASASLATEAQGLATAMYSTGSRSGQLRLGNLSPRPSVLWLLGSGEGRPLTVEYRWAELVRPAPNKP